MKKATKRNTIPVSERAIVQRINRKFLVEDGAPARELKKTRGGRAKFDLGDFYVLNTERNTIDEHHVDLETLARELGVLADWEHIIEGGE
jgi:hypothetical protein